VINDQVIDYLLKSWTIVSNDARNARKCYTEAAYGQSRVTIDQFLHALEPVLGGEACRQYDHSGRIFPTRKPMDNCLWTGVEFVPDENIETKALSLRRLFEPRTHLRRIIPEEIINVVD